MSLFGQLRRYTAVGLGSTVTDLSAYALLARVAGFDPLIANLISRPLGGLFSFVGNKVWTFERRQVGGTNRELVRFWTIWFGAYAASEALVWLFHHHFHYGPFLTKLCAEAPVCVVVFLTHRYWTFHRRPKGP